ncbi:MAG: hypothetical protein SP1CHLAM54_10100 [Chlamydiia bacterium]|nr:hypothetical protein [Chlamydiia bacterium]MCH9615916.1 hypothetical protein [Chlamydiia bacterium]MCH9628681.1 hypothetical protein [Chlamydiia bacterium]
MDEGCDNKIVIVDDYVLRTPKCKTQFSDKQFKEMAELSVLIGDEGIGPTVYSVDLDTQTLKLEYIDARPFPTYEEDQKAYHDSVRLLKRFHAIAPFHEYSSPKPFSLEVPKSPLPKHFFEAMEKTKRLYLKVLPYIEAHGVLCHGDFHTRNVLLGKEPKLIDFDYTCYGHPFYDLAKFSIRLPKPDRLSLLKTYLGHIPTSEERIQFECIETALLMNIAINRFKCPGEMTIEEMETLLDSGPLPSCITLEVKESPQRGALYALSSFLSRYEELESTWAGL